jgi:4-amino-4-deoxy-L-arabinose transferase-like glycosyltransferase
MDGVGRRAPSLSRLLFEEDGPAARVATRAVLALAAAGLLLSLATAADLPALYGADEKVHLAYVGSLLDGQLPTVDTPVPADGGRFPVITEWYGGAAPSSAGPRGDVWVANHPPLQYVLAAPATAAASLTGTKGPAEVMRVLSAGAFAVAAVATAGLAWGLVPGRRDVAVAAAGLVALTPCVVGHGALGYNDGLGVAIAAVALAVVVRVVQAGPSRARLIALLVLCPLAAFTRVGLVPLIPLAAAVWLVQRGRQDRRAGVWEALLIVGVAVVLAGPFYLRNIDLYGDLTGSAYLAEKFGYPSDLTTVGVLLDPTVWLGMWQSLWAESGNGARVGGGGPGTVLGTGLMVGVGVVLASAVGWVRLLVEGARPARSTAWAWVVAGLFVVGTVVGVASHLASGWFPFARFLLPAQPVVATALAVGLVVALPWAVVAVATLAGLLGVNLVLLARAGPYRTLVPNILDQPAWFGVVEAVTAGGAVAACAGGLWLLSWTARAGP